MTGTGGGNSGRDCGNDAGGENCRVGLLGANGGGVKRGTEKGKGWRRW